MSDQVACGLHGSQRYSMICVHLVGADGLHYCLIDEEESEPAMAWCGECDLLLEADRGWSDRADEHADWKLFCKTCFASTLEGHVFATLVQGPPS